MLLELDHVNVIKYYDFFLHQEKSGTSFAVSDRSIPYIFQLSPTVTLYDRTRKQQEDVCCAGDVIRA